MSLYMYGKERHVLNTCVKYLQLTFSYFYNLFLRFFDLGGIFFLTLFAFLSFLFCSGV